MAEKMYKVNEAIEIVYQAPNKESGLSGVVAEIFLPNNQKDSNFPDVSLTEIGNTGIYAGMFTPDQEGEWKAVCHKADGDGQVVKRYSVGAHNISDVGETINTVHGKTDNIVTKVDNIDTTVDDIDAQLDTVESKIDNLDNKVSTLDTPPMVS
ncbi:MAG: hypothetical protein ACTSUO_08495 [Candidatus Thorarchaeota archaeon]